METHEFNDSEAQAAAAKVFKPALTGPKRQHYLPEFYLHGFAQEGNVAVYNRDENKTLVLQPKNTGVIGHFYTMTDVEGRKRFEIENLLAEFEGKAKPIIDKLTAKADISADERANLAIFIALGAFRTPDLVESVQQFNSEAIRRFTLMSLADEAVVFQNLRRRPRPEAKTDDELRAEAKELVEFAQAGQWEVTTNHKWAVRTSLDLAWAIAPILAGRDWVVVHRSNDRSSFITTDAPVHLTTVEPRKNSIWGVGFGNSDALVVFPLNQACTLLMYGQAGDLQHIKASQDQVRRINLTMAANCKQYVIGRHEALVRSLAATVGLAEKQWQPKMKS